MDFPSFVTTSHQPSTPDDSNCVTKICLMIPRCEFTLFMRGAGGVLSCILCEGETR